MSSVGPFNYLLVLHPDQGVNEGPDQKNQYGVILQYLLLSNVVHTLAQSSHIFFFYQSKSALNGFYHIDHATFFHISITAFVIPPFGAYQIHVGGVR